MKKILFTAILCLSAVVVSAQSMLNKLTPQMQTSKQGTQLMVDGKPFLMLAGELHNSSTGSAHYMRDIWQRLADKNLNTVIAGVSWETVEPQEGKYDFSLVDSTVIGARKAGLRLVLIWFASWKNGTSTYIPEWVKTNSKKYPLAHDSEGNVMNTLSALGENSMAADAAAFSKLMKHIKDMDSKNHTVIAMQVENELGTIDVMGSFSNAPNIVMRDYSDAANKAFNSQVPEKLLNYLKANKKKLHPAIDSVWTANGCKMKGTWEEVFGKGMPAKMYNFKEMKQIRSLQNLEWTSAYPYLTEEIFNAWNYAHYVEQVAKAGKNAYSIPMYVNAWLKQSRAREPGRYPSGGPQSHLLDIWRAGAPDIDFYAPDLYATGLFDWVCNSYIRNGNPLMMPETVCTPDGAARAFYIFGRYHAIGYSPFGIDGNGLLLTANPQDHSIDKAYGCLKHLATYIEKYRGTPKMQGLLMDKDRKTDHVIMGKYNISIMPFSLNKSQAAVGAEASEKPVMEDNVAGLIVFQLGPDEFLVAGGVGNLVVGVTKSETSKAAHVGLLSVREISFDANGNQLVHHLNGDEVTFGGPVIRDGEVKCFHIKMYEY